MIGLLNMGGRHRRALAILLAAAIAAPLVLAGGPTRTGGPLSLTPARADIGCSWYGESDQRDVNVGAPDLDAEYLYAPLDGLAGSQIEITGSYPHARYLSFTLYGQNQQAQTSIYDAQIAADPGSHNPFTGPVRPGQATNYTVHVLFENAPSHPAPNTLYAGPATGTNAVGFMVLRIYIPQSAASPSGGVPWPQVSVLSADGSLEFREGACATIAPSTGAAYWKAYAAEDPSPGQATPADGTTSPPQWTRSFSNGFGNQQNSYLQVLVSHHWGQIVVSHFRAPTFPNTSAGQPVYGRHDVRYWSVCTYDSTGTAVFGCVPDYRAPQDRGWVTFVVSPAGQRPSNATAAQRVSWLPWGPANEIQVMERNMLPAASFTGASQRIAVPADNPDAARIMGHYYPTSAYCSVATFQRGGWQACLPALAKELARHHRSHRHHRRRHASSRRRRDHHAPSRHRHRHRHR